MQNLKEWEDGGSFIGFGEHRIFTRKEGEGKQILVCIHGFPTASFDYSKIWNELVDRFTVITFDLIGYGFSDKPRDYSYTTSDQADVLDAVLEHYQVTNFHTLTHDYGNTILCEYIARHSDDPLDYVCMMNGALFPETHRPILAQKILISRIGALFGKLIPEAAFRKSLASVFGAATQPSEQEMEEFMALLNRNNGRAILHLLIQYMRERQIYRERWVGALDSITKPFRFINGLDDPVSGAHLVKRFREVVPQFEDIVELENTGHFPHFERPKETIRHILEFHSENNFV